MAWLLSHAGIEMTERVKPYIYVFEKPFVMGKHSKAIRMVLEQTR
jgi:hypothetical protein